MDSYRKAEELRRDQNGRTEEEEREGTVKVSAGWSDRTIQQPDLTYQRCGGGRRIIRKHIGGA